MAPSIALNGGNTRAQAYPDESVRRQPCTLRCCKCPSSPAGPFAPASSASNRYAPSLMGLLAASLHEIVVKVPHAKQSSASGKCHW